jgi:hypothetical protein
MYSLVSLRESGLYEVEPVFLLVLHLLLVEPYLILKQRYDAGVEVFDDKTLKGVVIYQVWTVILEILYKGGIVYRRRAVYDGIIVVKY